MARAPLTIQQASIQTPLSPATMTTFPGSGAGNGFTVALGSNLRTLLIVSNGSGGTRTLTILNVNSNKQNGIVLPTQTFSLPTGAGVPGVYWLGPFDYQDSNQLIAIDIDTLTSVTAACVQIPAFFQ